MLALVEAVEGRDNRLEYSLFGCPCLGDRQFLLLGMLVHVGQRRHTRPPTSVSAPRGW